MRENKGSFDQAAYIRGYVKVNVRYKKMNFNVNQADDMALYEWIEKQPEGTSNYLKRLVRDDMNKR